MNWRKYLPRSAKRRLRGARNLARSFVLPPQKSQAELLAYWRDPYDGENAPESFLNPFYARRTEYLVKVVRELVGPDTPILEVGCGVGRNLKALASADYHRLTGIEINEDAVRLLKACFPDVAERTTLHTGPVEEVAARLQDREFDLVFTMETLAHVHGDGEGAFREIARIGKRYLLTFEDEGLLSWRTFPRNYRKVFERFGWKQLREEDGQSAAGLAGGYVARLFTRD
jgi:SAM-dependent methyltransferase